MRLPCFLTGISIVPLQWIEPCTLVDVTFYCSEQSCALEWNDWDIPSKIRQYQVENK